MRRGFAVVALCASLSCRDSSGPDTLGTVSFTYSGVGSGTFTASGAAPSLNNAPPTGSAWAVGFVEGGETFVAAASPRSGGLVDLALLRVGLTTSGSQSIDPSCDMDGFTPCTGMTLSLNFNGNGDTADAFCALTSGTIVVAAVSTGRAQGTFSGQGECAMGTFGSTFTVSNGSFDVALVAAPN